MCFRWMIKDFLVPLFPSYPRPGGHQSKTTDGVNKPFWNRRILTMLSEGGVRRAQLGQLHLQLSLCGAVWHPPLLQGPPGPQHTRLSTMDTSHQALHYAVPISPPGFHHDAPGLSPPSCWWRWNLSFRAVDKEFLQNWAIFNLMISKLVFNEG